MQIYFFLGILIDVLFIDYIGVRIMNVLVYLMVVDVEKIGGLCDKFNLNGSYFFMLRFGSWIENLIVFVNDWW